MLLPAPDKLAKWTKDIVEQCNVSQTKRMALARQEKTWLYTGRGDGRQAIYNKLIVHCDKLASLLFAPADLRFFVEFENDYGPDWMRRGQVAGRYLTREFARRDLDITFGQAVFESLPHGCCFIKIVWGSQGPVARLRMPWNLGVYREDETDLYQQEAVCETSYVTAEELWRRVSHRGDAREIMRRAQQYARRKSATDDGDAFLHQILLTGTAPQIGTPDQPTSGPGGFVQIGPPQGATVPPDVAAPLIRVHELFVVNDETDDYTTIQMCEPDIILAPRLYRHNLFMPHCLPWTQVCVNPMNGYFWGRSELVDLLKPQSLLADRLEDVKRIMSLQYDRIYAFLGFSGMNDERYDRMKNDGWIAEPMPGAKVEDLTPKLPENAMEEIAELENVFDRVAGMDNVLSGKGEPGVRAGTHFQGLVRTASPRLRDRAIRAERQLQEFAESFMWFLAENDARAHWTDAADADGKTDFYLSQLPDDARVLVDGHSASPVYEQDHANTAAFLFKAGAIDRAALLDLLPIPNRDLLKEQLSEREKAQQKFMQSLPLEDRIQLMTGHSSGGHSAHHR